MAFSNYDPKTLQFNRSFKVDKSVLNSISEEDQQFLEGNELLKERRYLEAENLFIKVLSNSPNHLDANSAMADLYFRALKEMKIQLWACQLSK